MSWKTSVEGGDADLGAPVLLDHLGGGGGGLSPGTGRWQGGCQARDLSATWAQQQQPPNWPDGWWDLRLGKDGNAELPLPPAAEEGDAQGRYVPSRLPRRSQHFSQGPAANVAPVEGRRSFCLSQFTQLLVELT